MPNLTDTIKQLAEETGAVVLVGYRGYGSGGWFASLVPGTDKSIESEEVYGGTPMGAVRALSDTVIQKLDRKARKAAAEATSATSTLDRLRARP